MKEEKEEKDRRKTGWVQLKVIWGLLICVWKMWECASNEGLKQSWSALNSYDSGEGEEEKEENWILFNIILTYIF